MISVSLVCWLEVTAVAADFERACATIGLLSSTQRGWVNSYDPSDSPRRATQSNLLAGQVLAVVIVFTPLAIRTPCSLISLRAWTGIGTGNRG